MSDDHKLQDDILRGQSADSVLNNIEYKKAFVMIKATLINGFEQTKFKEHKERDEVWRKLQALNWLETELTNVMQTGKISQKSLLDRAKNIIGL